LDQFRGNARIKRKEQVWDALRGEIRKGFDEGIPASALLLIWGEQKKWSPASPMGQNLTKKGTGCASKGVIGGRKITSTE